MSLIGDALRKARQETAERENERKGVLFSARIADAPARSNLGLGIALGAFIAIVATIAGGAAVWWVLGGADQDPSTGIPVAESVAETDSEAVAVAVAGTGAVTESVAGAETVAVSGTESVTGAETGSADPDTDTATATDTETDTVPVTVTDTDSVPATETGFVGKENGADVYLMEADIGGVTLSLDYIVFRVSDPYAEINGTEVHVGGVVAGFRVKSVERDRVVLSNGRRTVVLRAP